MGVVLKPMECFQYPSDICRYECMFFAAVAKDRERVAKGSRKV